MKIRKLLAALALVLGLSGFAVAASVGTASAFGPSCSTYVSPSTNNSTTYCSSGNGWAYNAAASCLRDNGSQYTAFGPERHTYPSSSTAHCPTGTAVASPGWYQFRQWP